MNYWIEKQDLKTLTEMGKALWMDPREREIGALETLSAVTLLDLSPEKAVEKAARALLERVTQRGGVKNFRANLQAGLKMDQTFFALPPADRFLLVALHLGRWSYARLARVWDCTPEEIETRAWTARLRFASSEHGALYPAGASAVSPNCPTYDPNRPWTQRFLDEEIPSGRERLYLQNHLMACDSCRNALQRCRESYYQVERALPRLDAENADDAQLMRSAEAISRRSRGIRYPTERTFRETLEIFTRRDDVRIALIVFGFLLAAWAWKIF